MNRDRVPFFVSRILAWRPVRWATPVGDYDGRERTLEVFNADLRDQRRLLVEIDKHRQTLAEAAGGPLIVIFHSVKQTEDRYGEFARSFPRPLPRPTQAIAPPPERCVDVQDENGPHRRAA
jgi:hypothetical protein